MRPKGSSVLWAEWRRGLKDLQTFVANAWNGIVPGHEEPGSIANPTQQMVTANIRGDNSFDAKLQRYASHQSMYSVKEAQLSATQTMEPPQEKQQEPELERE